MPSIPVKKRFLRHIEKKDGCWNWTGCIMSTGYGMFLYNGIRALAHRVSYDLFKGGVESVVYVCHHCDNRKCVRPSHLYAGNGVTNVRDAMARSRRNQPTGTLSANARLSESDVEMILTSSSSGAALGRSLGVSPGIICKVRTGMAYSNVFPHLPRNPPKVVNNPSPAVRKRPSKLSRIDIPVIRKLYVPGDTSLALLAKRFGVSSSAIQRVVTKKTWGWLQ